MMDIRVVNAGFLVATLFVACAAFGDESLDDLQPAVDTSAVLDDVVTQGQTDEGTAAADADESGDQPAEPEAVVAADVTRSTSAGGVMDEMTLGRTEITGNQELPKVLYIVPWQKADPGDLMGRPVNTLLDEVLAPLDREEFVRQVDYYDDLYRE